MYNGGMAVWVEIAENTWAMDCKSFGILVRYDMVINGIPAFPALCPMPGAALLRTPGGWVIVGSPKAPPMAQSMPMPPPPRPGVPLSDYTAPFVPPHPHMKAPWER